MKKLRFICAVTLLATLTLLVSPAMADGWEPPPWAEPPSEHWYFKPPYEDYVWVGIPDFDQTQDPSWADTGGAYTYCGPTAVANSLWWFDSKFEPNPVPPPVINDNYPLVQAYNTTGTWDDHDPSNVNVTGTVGMSGELVDVLAYYMDTDGQRTGSAHQGTNVEDMNAAIDKYIADKGLWDEYYRKTRWYPCEDWIFQEVWNCEDVVLLLGFWVEQVDGTYERAGGHYVTVAGVDHEGPSIAISDPFRDHAEAGNPGFVPIPHPLHSGGAAHNDTQYVSYDAYPVVPFGPAVPGSYPYPTCMLSNYVATHIPISQFWGQNNSLWLPPAPSAIPVTPRPVYTSIDYAVVVSPIYKKPGYSDYAPYGVPDFDQTQDPTWGFTSTLDGLWHWSYDGPVGEANSVWWLDSKFEPYPVPPVPPTTPNDNYDLVQAYGSWDDHSPSNVEPLVEALAWYMNTDGIQTPFSSPHGGTFLEDHVAGKEEYLEAVGMDDQFYVKLLEEPDFKEVAEQVEDCEDVELLLGFWQFDSGWDRIGGHYVTVAGVDSENHWIVFSDPYLDAAEDEYDPDSYGQVDYWHQPHEITPTAHNDARYLSHDAYSVWETDSPGGSWGPEAYGYYPYYTENGALASGVSPLAVLPDVRDDIFANFNTLNWQRVYSEEWEIAEWDPSLLVYTEVEAAIVLSPGSNLTVTKTVNPSWGKVDDPITYTITYGNSDPAGTAYKVVISDQLPISYVKDITYTTSPSPDLSSSGVLKWEIGKLKEGASGTLTITAVISDTGLFTNTVEITSTTTLETDSSDNEDSATVIGVLDDGLGLPLVMKKD